jgi:hypothetical protein
VLPLLDGFIHQMSERFSNTQTIVASVLHLVPSVLCAATSFYEDERKG